MRISKQNLILAAAAAAIASGGLFLFSASKAPDVSVATLAPTTLSSEQLDALEQRFLDEMRQARQDAIALSASNDADEVRRAVHELEDLAAAGDIEATTRLAEMTLSRAVELMTRAASFGDARAIEYMIRYERFEGRDDRRLYWKEMLYERAKSPDVAIGLSRMYLNGQGTSVDVSRAVGILEPHAQAGSAAARLELASILFNESRREDMLRIRDPEKARTLLAGLSESDLPPSARSHFEMLSAALGL